jgi:hypothetical protein
MPRQINANSTTNGKAYEYACVLAIESMVSSIRPIDIVNDSSMEIAKERYKSLTKSEQRQMLLSANAGIKTLITMEPKILEDGTDKLTISIQTDTVGLSGDVRDVLIIRRDINWEIGISVKHNHFALKHSRLSDKLDFGQQWLRSPCSDEYFKEIRPYFDELKTLKTQKVLWRNVLR